MPREVVEPEVREEFGHEEEHHPAFALIGASRVQAGGGGAVLFDSEIRHQHYVVVSLRTASRQRDLNHDRIHPSHGHGPSQVVEIAMSEAQWASFVSSMNIGNGVPCTLQWRQRLSPEAQELIEHLAEQQAMPDDWWQDRMAELRDGRVPGLPYAPRMEESLNEVRGAGDAALEKIREALDAVEEKPTKANIRHLRAMVNNAPSNMEFAAKSLAEHAENTVQKARHDIEAMAVQAAEQLGLDPAEAKQTLLPETTEEASGDA